MLAPSHCLALPYSQVLSVCPFTTENNTHRQDGTVYPGPRAQERPSDPWGSCSLLSCESCLQHVCPFVFLSDCGEQPRKHVRAQQLRFIMWYPGRAFLALQPHLNISPLAKGISLPCSPWGREGSLKTLSE